MSGFHHLGFSSGHARCPDTMDSHTRLALMGFPPFSPSVTWEG
jgi:hypothetical protein